MIFNAADHIAEDHIHTNIACNFEKPQQKYHLGMVSNRLLGGGGGGGKTNDYYKTPETKILVLATFKDFMITSVI